MSEPDVLTALRKGKEDLRARRRRLSLPEKVVQVVELQRAVLPAYRRRRALKPWEKVWDLKSAESRKR